MKKSTLIIAALLLSVVWVACTETKSEKAEAAKEPAEQKLSQAELIEKGKKLIAFGGCEHCHSPKMMTDKGPVIDPERRLSGHPSDGYVPPSLEGFIPGPMLLFNGDLTVAKGPWGTSFSANITPHATGIGNWSLEQFKKSIKEGKYKGLDGSRMLLPPMPWQSIAKVASDEDLEAMYAYLMSIKPVDNLVPAAIPPGS